MFTLCNKNYLCIVDYHSKFPVIKKTEDLSADSLILACKIIFQNMVCIRKLCQMQVVILFQINSKDFEKNLNIEQVVS